MANECQQSKQAHTGSLNNLSNFNSPELYVEQNIAEENRKVKL